MFCLSEEFVDNFTFKHFIKYCSVCLMSLLIILQLNILKVTVVFCLSEEFVDNFTCNVKKF